MNKKELRALRRPFVRALFQHNLFNLFMTVLASVLNALCMLILSWLIKEVVDLISGSSTYSFQILLTALSGISSPICKAAWSSESPLSARWR